MRLARRAVLTGLGAFALPGAAQAIEQTRFPVGISARPIAAFEPRRPEQRRFGALQFRSGLVLSSGHPRFGGFSGLARLNGGRDLVAVTDRGYWLTAKVAYRDDKLSALEDGEMAAILGGSGRPLARSGLYDTESLCIHEGVAFIGIERKHEIVRFDWARDGVEARARPVPVPPEIKRLPRNRGLEALGVMPVGPLKGALIAIAERSGKEDESTLGAILGGPQPGLFKLARHDGYDITDLAFLPGGDMLVLERWYQPLRGVGMRMRRIAGRDIRPGALVDGQRLIEADLGFEIDNMEGLSVHLEEDKTILTLISDDNFSFLQRTLLLEFELLP
ncbi:MAG: esterase-like activity of phytase family protein [Bosea sp.]|uniref:esterase-like activity of phytase family protein n=1 Tax=Bosea sp. (in: a-proteobacteria) TaxID=1871050 RepID=UPI001AD1243A|nr:esterase-like activity of phytase family protein [Bosea sp. (in: a-proteobacteria)]MBN9453111.1 esterase-like activity of phytase family protein [Bosea sp. (in: a-proteobacteria)]